MKRITEFCETCERDTAHLVAGFLPRYLVTGEQMEGWVQSTICTECGSLFPQHITEEQYRRAEERYVQALYDEGLINEDRLAELLE